MQLLIHLILLVAGMILGLEFVLTGFDYALGFVDFDLGDLCFCGLVVYCLTFGLLMVSLVRGPYIAVVGVCRFR